MRKGRMNFSLRKEERGKVKENKSDIFNKLKMDESPETNST